MLTRTVPRAGDSPFAHLARPPVVGKQAAEDDEDKKKEEAKKAEDEEDSDDMRASEKESDDDKEDDKKDGAKKGKKAKKASDDNDGDKDDETDASARAIRARERGRIRAIMTSDQAKANPVAAMHLATGTSMSRTEVIETLTAMQASASASEMAEPTRDPLRSRMAEVPVASVGSDPKRPEPNLAEKIVLAGKKRRGEI